MERRAFINAFKKQNPKSDSAGSDSILGNMTINDSQGYVEITMNNGDGFETYRYDSTNMLNGMSLVKTNEEYSIKQTNDKLQTTLALVDENDYIISSMRGAVEIAVNGNKDLKDKVMKVGGIKGYTSERELMTGGV